MKGLIVLVALMAPSLVAAQDARTACRVGGQLVIDNNNALSEVGRLITAARDSADIAEDTRQDDMTEFHAQAMEDLQTKIMPILEKAANDNGSAIRNLTSACTP